jgi:DNA (cytosine-5)-methyltransferase 1
MKLKENGKFKVFSAFTGIGGFDLGIINALGKDNVEIIGTSEVDKYAIKIYEKHFPDRTNYGNIKKIKEETLPDFDMFCGGWPCQDHSIAGKRAGLCGARSGLFYEIIRIIRKKQPRIVFLENVKGLFSSDEGRDFARVLIELDESGYDVEWQCLNSKNFGVPQNRERVFIVGHLRRTIWKPVFPIRENIKGIDERSDQTTNINTLTGGGHSGGLHSSMTLLKINRGNQESNRIYSPEGLSKCLSNGGGQGAKTGLYVISDSGQGRKSQLQTEIIAPLRTNNGAGYNNVVIQSHHPRCGNPAKGGTGELSSSEYSYTLDSIPHIVNQIRRLTPLECERLQGYPDFWTAVGSDDKPISDTQRYKMCGNAVSVPVIEAIVQRMRKNIDSG